MTFMRILTSALALSLVLALGAGCEEQEVDDTEGSYGDASITSDLFLALGKGAAKEVGGAAVGWALSALGLSSGDDAALEQINGDLQEIISQLAEIEQELSVLIGKIEQLDCDALSADINSARTMIKTLTVTYQGFVDDGAGTYGTAIVPPISEMTTWADNVLDQMNGVLPALIAIDDALMSVGSAQGIISACLQPEIVTPPVAGSIDDRSYYKTVQNMVHFYYVLQVQGLLLLHEAYHFRAQQASTLAPSTDDIANICISATEAEVIHDCNMVIEDTNRVYQDLAEQFLLGGAAFSNDNLLLRNNGADSTLWVGSLEDFTQSAGDSCSSPLTSADPCGLTVGNRNTGKTPFSVNYQDYDGWRPASSDELGELIGARGSKTPAAYLEAIGFQNATGKLVITGDSFEYSILSMDPISSSALLYSHATCFLDMDLTRNVVCHDNSIQGFYTEKQRACAMGVEPYFVANSHIATKGERNGFYDFKYDISGTHCQNLGYEHYKFIEAPGWETSNTSGANAQQYRWPALSIAYLTCTGSRSRTNPGGVPTRCGNDFDLWFDPQVPRPPTCNGTVFGVCQ